MATKPAKTAANAQTAFIPRIARVLTLPVLALAIDAPVYVKIDQLFIDGTPAGEMPDQEALDKGIQQPRKVRVIDLQTGQMMHLIIGDSLFHILAGEYPEDTYVGRGFSIMRTRVKRGRVGGTNAYTVAELDLS